MMADLVGLCDAHNTDADARLSSSSRGASEALGSTAGKAIPREEAVYGAAKVKAEVDLALAIITELVEGLTKGTRLQKALEKSFTPVMMTRHSWDGPWFDSKLAAPSTGVAVLPPQRRGSCGATCWATSSTRHSTVCGPLPDMHSLELLAAHYRGEGELVEWGRGRGLRAEDRDSLPLRPRNMAHLTSFSAKSFVESEDLAAEVLVLEAQGGASATTKTRAPRAAKAAISGGGSGGSGGSSSGSSSSSSSGIRGGGHGIDGVSAPLNGTTTGANGAQEGGGTPI
jgi:hypothetical protein